MVDLLADIKDNIDIVENLSQPNRENKISKKNKRKKKNLELDDEEEGMLFLYFKKCCTYIKVCFGK